MIKNGADILVETLIEQGVDTIFGYPGGSVLNIYDSLYKNSDRIRHVETSHEQGASHAADGYARATGKVGVCLATSGPGATNLVTGIATAYMDSIPMVAITGNVGTSLIGKDSFQEVYIVGITMPITKHNFMVKDVKDLAPTIRKAFQIAMSGRPGPVLIDIPKDITSATCEFTNAPKVTRSDSYTISDEDIKNVAKMIDEAERPMIYYGGGVEIANASKELYDFVKKTNIPSAHSMMAIGCIPDDDPLSLKMIGMHGTVSSNWAVEKSDLLICIGARFSDRVATNTRRFAPHSKVIHVDIDAAEINKNINSEYSIISDAKTFLERIIPAVKEAKHTEWWNTIHEWQVKFDYKAKDDESVIHPHQLMNTITEVCGSDSIITTDVGQHQLWASQYNGRSKPRHFLTSGGLGTMGYGYGAAIGAKIACPDKTVIHVTGDGSFHMNLMEVSTAVTQNLQIITVIFDNTVLGNVRQWQTMFYGKRYSETDLNKKTDYVKLAEAFGGHGFRVTNISELKDALQKALKLEGPVLIACKIDKDERVLPMIPAGGTVDDLVVD